MSLVHWKKCYICGFTRNAVEAKGLHFHRIPSVPIVENIRDRWFQFLSLPPSRHWTSDIWKNITLCSRHFEEELYNPHHDSMIRVDLKKGAAPTLSPPEGPGVLGSLFPSELLQMSDECGPSGSQVVQDQSLEMDALEDGHLCTSPSVDTSVSTPDTPMRGAISKFKLGPRKPNLKTKLGLSNRKLISPRSNRIYKMCKFYRDRCNRLAKKRLTLPASQTPGEREQGGADDFVAQELFRAHFENFSKPLAARRYTDAVKAMCLGIQGSSSRTYQSIRKMMAMAWPSLSTLNRIRQNVPLSTGISKVVLHGITKRLPSMSEIDKICVLMFDEMSLAKHLDYDCNIDHILGYQDIAGNRHPYFADHALVFMVRGLMSDWKQPVALHLGQAIRRGALENVIRETVVVLQNVGLKVVAIVSDMAQSNVSALHSLATKTMPERDDSTIKIGDELIFVFADPPHLLKVLRNNFLKYDVQFKGEGDKIKIAKFNILKEFLQNEKLKVMSKVYPRKFSDRHLDPSSKDKMRVKLAAQLFSFTVSTCVRNFGLTTGNSAAIDLAEFLDIVDSLFDSFNSSSPEGDQDLNSCVTGDSKHHAFWNTWRERLADWKFVVRSPSDKEPKTKCFQFWQRNIASVQSLWRKLRDLGVPKLKTRNLNQDPLENFFGNVRQHGGSNRNPTARLFLNIFKILALNSFTVNLVGRHGNVTRDHLPLLTSLLNSSLPSRGDFDALETLTGVGYASSSIASFCSLSKEVESCTNWIGTLSNETTEGVVGFATDLLSSFIRKRPNYLFITSCFQCRKSTHACNHESPPEGKVTCDECHIINSSLALTMYKIYVLMIKNLQINGHKPHLSDELKACCRDVDLLELSCSEHQNELKELILDFIINFTINKFCNRVNFHIKSAARKPT